jgi:hypothetical protein
MECCPQDEHPQVFIQPRLNEDLRANAHNITLRTTFDIVAAIFAIPADGSIGFVSSISTSQVYRKLISSMLAVTRQPDDDVVRNRQNGNGKTLQLRVGEAGIAMVQRIIGSRYYMPSFTFW